MSLENGMVLGFPANQFARESQFEEQLYLTDWKGHRAILDATLPDGDTLELTTDYVVSEGAMLKLNREYVPEWDVAEWIETDDNIDWLFGELSVASHGYSEVTEDDFSEVV